MPVAGPNLVVMMLIQMEHDYTSKINKVLTEKMKLSMSSVWIADQEASLYTSGSSNGGLSDSQNCELKSLEAQKEKIEKQESQLDQLQQQYQTQLEEVQSWKESEQKIVQQGAKKGFQINI